MVLLKLTKIENSVRICPTKETLCLLFGHSISDKRVKNSGLGGSCRKIIKFDDKNLEITTDNH